MSSKPHNFLAFRYFSRFGLVTVLSLGLLSCGTQPIMNDEDKPQTDIAIAEQVREILIQAESSESPDRDQYYLQAASLLAEIDELDWARNLLASIDPDLLFVEDFVDYTLLYSHIAIETDSHFLAQRILTNPRVEQQWSAYSEEDAKLLRARRAELFALLGDPNKSVYERVRLSEYNLDLDVVQRNQDAIWENLMALTESELNQLRLTEPNRVLAGWYTLAALNKNDDADLGRQQATIEQWMAEWPDHPARFRLPTDLQLIKQLAENQPTRVALLLPLSDSNLAYRQAAQAIRDGFMGAYFQAKQRGSYVPQVRIHDTSNKDINAVYDLAVADGADFIIGPLDKYEVENLSLRPTMEVPTLALNDVKPTPYGFPINLYQFSLSPEAEASQVANRAWLEGHRHAMVLVPDSDVGRRAADTFTYTWEMLGGKVVELSFYAAERIDYENYSQVIKDGLLISESEQRQRVIRQTLGESVEFNPRRRQDVDFVFLFARTPEAEILRPTLNQHHAAGIPVYATRRVYAEARNKSLRDLNGIRFTALPWLFTQDQIKTTFVKNTPKPNDEFYAMGIDSYRLYPRLPQLKQRAGAKFYGETGALSLNTDNVIQREQIWARIDNGQAEALPMVVSEAYVE